MSEDLREELVAVVDGYESEIRMFGDCGVRALFKITSKNGSLAAMRVCELEADHDGLHEWDPDFEWDDDGDEEER